MKITNDLQHWLYSYSCICCSISAQHITDAVFLWQLISNFTVGWACSLFKKWQLPYIGYEILLFFFIYAIYYANWCGIVVGASVTGSTAGRSASRNESGKLFTHMRLCWPSSINLYQCKVGAKQALHTTHWPHVRRLAASAGVWLSATETEISTALWALVAQGGL